MRTSGSCNGSSEPVQRLAERDFHVFKPGKHAVCFIEELKIGAQSLAARLMMHFDLAADLVRYRRTEHVADTEFRRQRCGVQEVARPYDQELQSAVDDDRV